MPASSALKDTTLTAKECAVRFKEHANSSILRKGSAKSVMRDTQLWMANAKPSAQQLRKTSVAQFGKTEPVYNAQRGGTSTLKRFVLQ